MKHTINQWLFSGFQLFSSSSFRHVLTNNKDNKYEFFIEKYIFLRNLLLIRLVLIQKISLKKVSNVCPIKNRTDKVRKLAF